MNLVLRLNKESFPFKSTSTPKTWSVFDELQPIFTTAVDPVSGRCGILFAWAEKVVAARQVSKLSAASAQAVAQDLGEGKITFGALKALAKSYRVRLRVSIGPFVVVYGESSSPEKHINFKSTPGPSIDIAQDGSLYAISKYSLKALKGVTSPGSKENMYLQLEKQLSDLRCQFLSGV